MITSTVNERVKWVRSLQRRRRVRDRENAFVAEGARWAQEFIAAEYGPELIFHSSPLRDHEEALLGRLRSLGGQVVPVSDDVMASLSDTESPQNLLVVARKPELVPPADRDLVIVADQLRDPGNLGTLLRTALAAGVDQLLLLEGTVDPYNPKVVRAAMGAQLHQPLRLCRPDELEGQLEGLTLWLAAVEGGAPYTEVDWRPPTALIIGGEAHGARDLIQRLAHKRTHIPISGPSDSLNAAIAAAILIFEIRRQRETE